MILLHITTVSQTLRFVLDQLLFMREKGWKVYASASHGEYEATLQRHAIPFLPVEMQRRITPLRDITAIARLWMAMRSIRPTVVHAHTPKAGLLGMISATAARIPVRVFQVHGLPHLAAHGIKYRLLFWATKLSCALAHRVLCVSPSIRQVLIDEKLCPEDKVVVPVHGSIGGVDARNCFNPARLAGSTSGATRARFDIPSTAFVMAFIGRLVRDKGLIELCEAWNMLRSRYFNLHLLIIGEFEPQDPIPPCIIEIFHADPRVHMAGFCSDMPEFYAAVDLVVLPTYREGFGNVLIEAGAMGLPVVATAVPGCLDAVQNCITGVLVPSHDAFALANAIERYINDPALRQSHGVRGRERALRDFRPEPLWEFAEREYSGLLTRRGLRLPDPVSAANRLAANDVVPGESLS